MELAEAGRCCHMLSVNLLFRLQRGLDALRDDAQTSFHTGGTQFVPI